MRRAVAASSEYGPSVFRTYSAGVTGVIKRPEMREFSRHLQAARAQAGEQREFSKRKRSSPPDEGSGHDSDFA